jgi:hypothetical protein
MNKNPSLLSFDFPSLAKIVGSTSISNNDFLLSIDGFASLSTMAQLSITLNSKLQSITGFQLVSTMTSLTIANQSLLETITGFASVTRLIALELDGLPTLANLTGSSAHCIYFIRSIVIVVLWMLIGFVNVGNLTGQFYLNRCGSLRLISGFGQTRIIAGGLIVSRTALPNYDFLSSLWSTSTIRFDYNSGLIDFRSS